MIDFVGIGAPKSGSTWLSKCLEEHPQILFSSTKSRKELAFFNDTNPWGDSDDTYFSYYTKGFDWYLKQFPEAEQDKVRGEFTVLYMADPVAPARIKKHLPNTKIVAILRNPIEVIYSLHWFFHYGAVLDVPKKFSDTLKKGLFLEVGFYYKQLKRYYELFDKDKIHIILFDDFKASTAAELEKLYSFLGVDPKFTPVSLNKSINGSYRTRSALLKKMGHSVFRAVNKSNSHNLKMLIMSQKKLHKLYSFLNKEKASYPPIGPDEKKFLQQLYHDDIEQLEKLINRDLSMWKA